MNSTVLDELLLTPQDHYESSQKSLPRGMKGLLDELSKLEASCDALYRDVDILEIQLAWLNFSTEDRIQEYKVIQELLDSENARARHRLRVQSANGENAHTFFDKALLVVTSKLKVASRTGLGVKQHLEELEELMKEERECLESDEVGDCKGCK